MNCLGCSQGQSSHNWIQFLHIGPIRYYNLDITHNYRAGLSAHDFRGNIFEKLHLLSQYIPINSLVFHAPLFPFSFAMVIFPSLMLTEPFVLASKSILKIKLNLYLSNCFRFMYCMSKVCLNWPGFFVDRVFHHLIILLIGYLIIN